MITMGIDPGTATTGYCVLGSDSRDAVKVIEYGCINTPKTDSPQKRLSQIHGELQVLFRKFQPKCVAVEKLFFNTNTKTAMAVGQARGVILLAAANAGLDVAEYTPLQVKMALTGYGRADKHQIQQMVKTLLKMDVIPKPDDAADALAVALCHISSSRFNSRIRQAS